MSIYILHTCYHAILTSPTAPFPSPIHLLPTFCELRTLYVDVRGQGERQTKEEMAQHKKLGKYNSTTIKRSEVYERSRYQWGLPLQHPHLKPRPMILRSQV